MAINVTGQPAQRINIVRETLVWIYTVTMQAKNKKIQTTAANHAAVKLSLLSVKAILTFKCIILY